jgi:DegV family protein with EDD domain
MTVRVVTDSTADLSPQTVEELQITVVPQIVMFGQESFRDGVDMTTDEFFERLTKSAVAPSTSQAPVGAFLEIYEALADETDAIVSIHLGSEFSGTVASATAARDALNAACRVEIVDSHAASLGIGFAVIAAAKAAKGGGSLDEVAAAARSVAERQYTLALLDTLEYARRGGRISRIESLLGNLLNIKPIIGIRGETQALGRARTRAGGLKRMFELAMAHPDIVDVGIMHATTPADAEMLADWVRERLPGVPIRFARLGPVLGAHGGPGIMAMVVVEGKNRA